MTPSPLCYWGGEKKTFFFFSFTGLRLPCVIPDAVWGQQQCCLECNCCEVRPTVLLCNVQPCTRGEYSQTCGLKFPGLYFPTGAGEPEPVPMETTILGMWGISPVVLAFLMQSCTCWELGVPRQTKPFLTLTMVWQHHWVLLDRCHVSGMAFQQKLKWFQYRKSVECFGSLR